MKGAMRLAQSISQQAIEEMGIFACISRRPEAHSTLPQKRDSEVDFSSAKGAPSAPTFAGQALGAPRDPAAIDVENLT
jgi:hypothetical protein